MKTDRIQSILERAVALFAELETFKEPECVEAVNVIRLGVARAQPVQG